MAYINSVLPKCARASSPSWTMSTVNLLFPISISVPWQALFRPQQSISAWYTSSYFRAGSLVIHSVSYCTFRKLYKFIWQSDIFRIFTDFCLFVITHFVIEGALRYFPVCFNFSYLQHITPLGSIQFPDFIFPDFFIYPGSITISQLI